MMRNRMRQVALLGILLVYGISLYAVTIQMRRDTAANWTGANPVLAAGEIGCETDTSPYQCKIGDGSTLWNALPYWDPPVGQLTWNVNPSVCTGDTNSGKLTVNGSDEIVCALDIGGGGGGGGDDTLVWRATNSVSPVSTGELDCFYWTEGAATLSSISASVLTQGGGGAGNFVLDVLESGTTIMATNKLQIDNAANIDDGTAVISDTAIANDAKLCVDVVAVTAGNNEAGVTVSFTYSK